MSESFEEHGGPAYLVEGATGSVQEGGKMSIQDEAYSEAMDAIAKLDQVRQVAAREIAQCYQDLRIKDQEIALSETEMKRLKALLTTAADALDCSNWFLIQPDGNLVKQLRRAAK